MKDREAGNLVLEVLKATNQKRVFTLDSDGETPLFRGLVNLEQRGIVTKKRCKDVSDDALLWTVD